MSRKIVELRAANVKRLTAVEIKPDGTLVVIGGKNGAGKSSVLDAIVYGLKGAGAIPSKPVRRGAEQADIELVLSGDPTIIVHRRIREDGKTTLEVKMVMADGITSKATSPQQLLDALCGKIAFDPLEFTRQRPQDQVNTLREIVGIDLADIDALVQEAYDERAQANRRVKETKARLDALPKYDDAPELLIVMADLLEELEQAQAVNRAADTALQRSCGAAVNVADAAREVRGCQSIVRGYELKVEEMERALARARTDLEKAEDQQTETVDDAAALRKIAEAMPTVECDPIHQRLREAEATNKKIHANIDRRNAVAEHQKTHVESGELTDEIERLRTQRIERMNAAQWPLEGLGFNDEGVTFGDLPFEQASSAERLRIATAIGFAQHPDLNMVMIHDGSLLDEDSLAAIADVAEAHGGQVFIERVSVGEECFVIIEDGAVKQPAAAAEPHIVEEPQTAAAASA